MWVAAYRHSFYTAAVDRAGVLDGLGIALELGVTGQVEYGVRETW